MHNGDEILSQEELYYFKNIIGHAMQLYALDADEQLRSARSAFKQSDYYCLECRRVVRLRGGPYRQPHFYHLDPAPFCRQHQKGPIHLQLQSYFVNLLPPGDCSLEYRFPSINRIADVAWLSQKIVFEIQYSPILAEEVLARNRDYQKVGWTVVWILHDHRFNQIRLSGAEMALRGSTHFFSNMNRSGVGMIYDQFDIHLHGLRKGRLPQLPVDCRELRQQEPIAVAWPLALLAQRASQWKVSFKGDLASLFLDSPSSHYLQLALAKEKEHAVQGETYSWRQLPAKLWRRGVVIPYQMIFRFFLERSCR